MIEAHNDSPATGACHVMGGMTLYSSMADARNQHFMEPITSHFLLNYQSVYQSTAQP